MHHSKALPQYLNTVDSHLDYTPMLVELFHPDYTPIRVDSFHPDYTPVLADSIHPPVWKYG